MKKLALISLAFLVASCGGTPTVSASPAEPSLVASSLLSSETSSPGASSAASSAASSSQAPASSSVPAASSSAQEESALDPMGEPYIGRQYYLNHIGDIYGAWQKYRGRGVTIAVIDVGFNPDHEDFKYADGTSKVSAKSASFVTNGDTTTTSVGIDKVVNMGESHGTFCAGVAAAAVNGKGVAGIAPEAGLLLLKTDCKPKSIAKAFTYAADNGAKVVTISIGSYYNYGGDLVNDGSDLGTVFDAPVKYCYDKGIPVISAGGNGGLEGIPTEFTFPGCVDNVIGVGGLAANSSSEIWSGSSYNPSSEWVSIDVLAPADMMFGCCHYSGKTYDGTWNGTSFASPIVAGMAALYFEANPGKNAKNFEQALYASCHALTTSKIATKDQLGHGRVDVGRLLGLSSSGNVTAKIKASWASGYAYAWNSVSGQQLSAWPGKALTKNGNTFTVTIDSSKYDSIIFTQTKDGPQTVDIGLNSFLSGKTLDLTSPTQEVGCLVGTYQ